jgi:hypothetical protein
LQPHARCTQIKRLNEPKVSMMARWHCEHASENNDLWLVGLERRRLHVLAPPGVALCRGAEAAGKTRTLPEGWRWASWERPDEEHWPIIDEDPPDRVRRIDTEAVLFLIDAELHELIWSCLWSQLQIARRIGRQSPGLVPGEDLARTSALSAAWLRDELARAFPERTALLEPVGWEGDWDIEGRSDPTELIRPQCQRCEHHDYQSDSHTLRSLARWIQFKLSVSNSECHHVWHAGEAVDGICNATSAPGDHSDFGWDEPNSETEEMLLP